MSLSPHFDLSEFTHSETAIRRGIPNEPDAAALANLTRLCAILLEPARLLLGVPLHVSSGYRCDLLNVAVGGKPGSAHREGRAADVQPVGMTISVAFTLLEHSGLPYDQLIAEGVKDGVPTWLHLAIAREGEAPRRMAFYLTKEPPTEAAA